MVQLNDSLLWQTSVTALMIIGGNIVRNSGEKLGLEDHEYTKHLGMGLSVFGWLFATYVLSKGRADRLPLAGASIAILVSIMSTKMCDEEGKKPGKIFPLLSVVGWLALGYYAGDHMNGKVRYLGLLASALTLGNTMYSLPYEHEKNVIGGPGMPMFVVAWCIIIYLNSTR